jgi:high-affinity Fe2+/Pb2+ permease
MHLCKEFVNLEQERIMEAVDTLYDTYTREKRRCMFIGQLLFVHGLFTAGWFVLMIMFELSKNNIEDFIFVGMLVTAYIMGMLYRSMKKKVKDSWTDYNKEKNKISNLNKLRIEKEKDIQTVSD